MKTKILRVLAAGLLAGVFVAIPEPARAGISFSNDTSDELIGSFSFEGEVLNYCTDATSFQLLPRATQTLCGGRDAEYLDIWFFTQAVGYDTDNPTFDGSITGSEQSFADMTGVFTNTASTNPWTGPPVYWRFYAFNDTGGALGAFTGNFCFATSSATCTAVPEPGSLALLGLGLLGLGFARRKAA